MLQHRWRQHPVAAAFLLLALAAGGCTGEPEPVDNVPRVAVFGDVTFDGRPLPAGKIQFQPIGSGPAVMAVGDIHDGHFSIDQPVGPSPGKYRILISSRPATTISEGEEPGSAKLEPEKIPKQYNVRSKLEVDVAPEGPVDFHFDLVKKP